MPRANEPTQMNLQEISWGKLLACHVSKGQSTGARVGAKLTGDQTIMVATRLIPENAR